MNQHIACELLFLQNHSCTQLCKLHGIVVLMVLCHIGRWNQDTGPAHGRYLCQCQGACAADDKICRRKKGGHIINVLPYLKALVVRNAKLFT